MHADVILQHLRHQPVDGATRCRDQLHGVGAADLLLERALDRFDLTANLLYAFDQPGLFTNCVGHRRNLAHTLGGYYHRQRRVSRVQNRGTSLQDLRRLTERYRPIEAPEVADWPTVQVSVRADRAEFATFCMAASRAAWTSRRRIASTKTSISLMLCC